MLSNNQVLRVVNSIKIDTVKGNTRGSNQTDDIPFISDTSMPKRRKLETHSNEEEAHHQVPIDSPKLRGMFGYKISKQCHVCTNYNATLQFVDAISEAVKASIFTLVTPEARSAQQTATELHQWFNRAESADSSPYECYLTHLFNLWTSVPPVNSSVREQIWQRFSCFISSQEYVMFWTGLYSKAKTTASSPHLSLYLTQSLFIRFWTHKYPISQNTTNHIPNLTGERIIIFK